MRNLILALIVAVGAMVPISAGAGEHLVLVQQGAPATIAGIDRNKVLAIGAGVVIGATAASALTFRGAMIVGAVAGGLAGAWWYGDRSEFATLDPR